MARPQETFGKKEKEKKRLKKREEKQRKKVERKSNAKSGDLNDMLVYVDENGQLTDTPPDPSKKVKIEAENIIIGVPKKEYIEEDPFHKGKVEFFNDSKGFGFINDLDSQEKYFVHISELIDEVKEGDNVIFEIERGMKGMNAVRVKKG
jgi:cold shock CspA family protein